MCKNNFILAEAWLWKRDGLRRMVKQSSFEPSSWGHCILFSGKVLYTHRASLQSGV